MTSAAARTIQGVPTRVLERVQRAVNELRWCEQRMRAWRAEDARLGLGGRHEARFFEANAAFIEQAGADINWFRTKCQALGCNADAVIVAFGGAVDIAPSAMALEYLCREAEIEVEKANAVKALAT
jgi:hypothetical protein